MMRGSAWAEAHNRRSARACALRAAQLFNAPNVAWANVCAEPANKASAAKAITHKATQASIKWPSAHVSISWSATTIKADTMAANNMALKPR